MKDPKITGLTKSAGFETGVRKTFPVSIERACNFLFSREGLAVWLGKLKDPDLKIGEPLLTGEGIQGKLRIFKPLSHLRMSWKKKEWENFSTLQLRLIKAKEKTTISFHQENLADNNQRETMRAYWKEILDHLSEEFKKINAIM